MSEQPEKYVCQKCGSPLCFLLDIDFDSYTPVIGEDGTISVEDVAPRVNFVSLIECSNPECDALWEETGWDVEVEHDTHRLRRVGVDRKPG